MEKGVTETTRTGARVPPDLHPAIHGVSGPWLRCNRIAAGGPGEDCRRQACAPRSRHTPCAVRRQERVRVQSEKTRCYGTRSVPATVNAALFRPSETVPLVPARRAFSAACPAPARQRGNGLGRGTRPRVSGPL